MGRWFPTDHGCNDGVVFPEDAFEQEKSCVYAQGDENECNGRTGENYGEGLGSPSFVQKVR
jgi:hypothetical protein